MKRLSLLQCIIAFIVVAGFSINSMQAQFGLSITKCNTKEDVEALIDSVFLDGVNQAQYKNISFTGDPASVGYFNGGYIFGFSIPQGIVMSSGFSESLDVANNCASYANGNTGGGSDPDLALAGGVSINDACVIEFDFKPSGDSVKFNYIFGSEEYHEWVNPLFADVFGFFLSGPGLSGPYTNNGINIALVPGTNNPVSIGTVNCGDQNANCTPPPGSGPGCQYLYDNTDPTNGSFNQCTMDAYTSPFVAVNEVQSCQWYHIKLAIGDAGDNAYDSGVFLEKGSFDPGNVEKETTYTHPTIDDVLYESCKNWESVIYFSIGSKRNDPYIIPFKAKGSATRGVDYDLFTTHPGDTVYIKEGELYDSIRIRTYYDNIEEGIEDVQIIFNAVMCGFGSPDTAFVYISDLPPMPDTTMIFETTCQQQVTVGFGLNIGGVGPYVYDWYTLNKNTPTVNYTPNGTNYFEIPCSIKDTCGQQVVDTAIVIVPALIADAGPDKSMCNQDSVQLEGASPGAQVFKWESAPFDPTLVGQESTPQPWVHPPNNTDYFLRVSDNCSNSDRDTTHVSLDNAVADAGPDKNICINGSTSLSCNPGESYLWSAVPPDPSLAGQENNQNITVSPTTTTTYTVEVTNDCNFSATDEVVVTVTPLPNADAGPDAAICFNESYQLQASGGTHYQWSSVPNDPSLFVNGQDTLPNPIVTPPSQVPYKYKVVVSDMCVNVDSMVLQVDPVPDLSVAADNDIICFGESATITITGSANYTWTASPPDPTLAGQENNAVIVVSPLVNTTYTLVGVVAGFNCPATLTQSIQVKPELFATFNTMGTEVCQEKIFSVEYAGNASNVATFMWDFDGAQIVAGSGSGPYDLSWDTDGPKNITLTVNDEGCISDPYSSSLTVLRSPVPLFDANIYEGCAPLSVDFANNSSNLGNTVDYVWEFGTSDQSTDEEPSFTYTAPGTYTVSLEVTNDAQCTDKFTQTAFINAYEVPTAAFNANPTESILESANIDFTDESSSVDALTWLWDFGDGATSTLENPDHTYTATGEYEVNLLVTTENGCENETTNTVIIHPDFAVYAPNAFTPDGDGMNDYFQVKGIGIKTYNLQIYNRWGQIIFESNNLEDEWDGTFNGEQVPLDSYVYIINYENMLNKEFTLKGSVTVVK